MQQAARPGERVAPLPEHKVTSSLARATTR
ncbi:MAG: hypothetical protein [Podoviridae sp. ctQNx1]|nr:MAG: hypothetical protein [Podoviridae sp. ctQNx1]UOF78138.1 hypothetical protein [Caudoviricetes sp.]